MRTAKIQDLRDIKNTVKKIMSTPKNSLIKIDSKRLRTVFEKYCVNFYPIGDYLIDQDNESVLNALILLFSQNDNFLKQVEVVKNDPGLHKGVFAFGDVGLGKTDFFEIMKFVSEYYRRCYNYGKLNFKIIHAGRFVVDFKAAEKRGDSDYFYNQHLKGKMLIDDFGTEPTYYGNELVGQLILDRYRYFKRNQDIITHITSNLNLDDIFHRYGKQVPDRIVEMCNIIKFPGETRRK